MCPVLYISSVLCLQYLPFFCFFCKVIYFMNLYCKYLSLIHTWCLPTLIKVPHTQICCCIISGIISAVCGSVKLHYPWDNGWHRASVGWRGQSIISCGGVTSVWSLCRTSVSWRSCVSSPRGPLSPCHAPCRQHTQYTTQMVNRSTRRTHLLKTIQFILAQYFQTDHENHWWISKVYYECWEFQVNIVVSHNTLEGVFDIK